MSFYERGSTTQPRDFLTREERTAIREAALEYGTIPSYKSLTPEARDRWKAHLAQRFEKPKAEVTPADWERANPSGSTSGPSSTATGRRAET